jgi:hypothetical protein
MPRIRSDGGTRGLCHAGCPCLRDPRAARRAPAPCRDRAGSRPAASDFLCFAKEIHQRKATTRSRPDAPAALALQSVSGPCAKLAPCARSDTHPALLRCRPAPPRRPRADDHPRRAVIGVRDAVECLRRRRAAQGAREPLRACLSERPQGASLQARPRPRAAQGTPLGAPSQARLSLVTFFAKTKKVTGRAALKRDVDKGEYRLRSEPRHALRHSVPEVPHPREHHRHATLVGGGDDLFVAHAAARLDHASGAGIDNDIEAITEREERVRGGCGTCQ